MRVSLSLCGPVLALLASACATAEPNAGPCPPAFALYDAVRVVEFADGQERLSSVGFTAEIQAVRSSCRYVEDKPIKADLEIDIGFGRGPAAQGDRAEYTYWVAVTRSNLTLITKEFFPLTVRFDKGEDRVFLRERIEEIVIPRAGDSVSGTNFEIIVGFELTDEQLAFNRAGKRFTIGAAN